MKKVIGIDLGGTYLRHGLVDESGNILHQAKEVVRKERSETAIIKQIFNGIQPYLKEKPVALGLGVPGIVSTEKGIVYSSPHYPDWNNFSITHLLQNELPIPVVIDNDANLVALGESWLGAGRDWDSFILLTLGTGIGGAIIIDRKIFHGTNGFAGEIGHMVLSAEGPLCPCGSRGCLEVFASASGLKRILAAMIEDGELPQNQALEDLQGAPNHEQVRELSELARKGSGTAAEIWRQFGYYLGIGLASIINATGIQKIILGGGLMGAQDLFLDAAKKELGQRTYQQTALGVEIRKAQLGDPAGILGASRLAFR